MEIIKNNLTKYILHCNLFSQNYNRYRHIKELNELLNYTIENYYYYLRIIN